MNKLLYFLFVFLMFVSCQAFAKQDKNIIKHTVVKGETITQIAQKYKVTPYDIYRLNPDAQQGIQVDAVLLIPKTTVGSALNGSVKTAAKQHTVQPKETWYGIAKLYSVSVEALEKANAEAVKDGLKVGQVIVIPLSSSEVVKENSGNTVGGNNAIHVVKEKETLYSIAKQYDTTVEKLEQLNPLAKNGLSVGDKIIIVGAQTTKQPIAKVEEVKVAVKTPSQAGKYEVQPKETLFGLSKKFNVSQEILLSLNPELKEGVREGMLITVPVTSMTTTYSNKTLRNLSQSLVTSQRKKLVVLVPFNVSRVQADTVLSIPARLKRDAFLNLTLDYYSGVLMAIDSAKQIGLNLDVKIYDSRETKNSSAIQELIASGDLQNADAIIGPFYPQNVELLAEALQNKNIPVISPIRELNENKSNIFQSLPTNNRIKTAMIDYLQSKNGNMIAMIDRKRNSSLDFIQHNFKQIKIIPLNDKGSITYDSIVPNLERNKTNYFIIESASTGMILNAISQYQAAKKNGYTAELVTLDMNATFETDEVFRRLEKERVYYPSITRFNDSNGAGVFAKIYKKKNNLLPNAYAVRGFDVTFDTMLRLSQAVSFEESIQTVASEQVENKFDYIKVDNLGYANKGIYILYNDSSDLTTKIAE